MENQVEAIQIWHKVETGGEATNLQGDNLKLVAYIVNGHPLKLDEGFMMEQTYIPKVQYKEMKKRLTGGAPLPVEEK